MVFDALCEIFENHNIIKKRIPHKKKMKFLCDKLNIEYKSETFEKIVELRNKLIHTALWAKTQPTSSTDAGYSKYVRNLHKLNECLIVAILKYNNYYGKHNWFSMTPCPFNIAE